MLALEKMSPAVVLQKVPLPRGHLHVVRDDLLDGGTKQRAAVPYLKDRCAEGFSEFIYASPFSGFAQVALAVACQSLGLRCTVFAERDAASPTGTHQPHEFTRLAERHGARVILTESLNSAETAASQYTIESSAALARCKVPLGFNDPSYRAHLRRALQAQWEHLVADTGGIPDLLWLPLGSGTLANIFREVAPPETRLACVNVHVLPESDARIENVRRLPNVEYHAAEQRFAEPSRTRPPVPSNLYYDAKLWDFIQTHAEAGQVWWNVAR